MISILAHTMTPEQVAELGENPRHIRDIDRDLASNIEACPPSELGLFEMARALCEHARFHGCEILAGSGSPGFTAILGRVAPAFRVDLTFAHSERVSQDQPQPDGSVKKVSIFKHVCFFTV